MKKLGSIAQQDHRDTIQQLLETLTATLHPHQHQRVEDNVNRILQADGPNIVAASYLRTVQANPTLANEHNEHTVTYDCRECLDMKGWQTDDAGDYLPCRSCRPLTYQLWLADHLGCRIEDGACRVCRRAASDAGVPLVSVATSTREPPSDDDVSEFIH